MQLGKQLLLIALISLCGICFFIYPACLSAQKANPHLYWQNETLPDTVRLKLLDSLIRKVHWRKTPDSTFYYIEQQLSLARAKNNDKYTRRALKYRGQLYEYIGNYQSAVPANQERITAYESADIDQEDRSKALAQAHRGLANSLRKVGRTSEALEQFETALRYAEDIGEKGQTDRANIFNSMGNLYFNLQNYELAQEKYQSALNLYQAIPHTIGTYSALNNLGLVSAKQEDYEKAIEYYTISLEMKEKAGDKKRMANTYGSIGDIYLIQGRATEAREYFLLAKALQEELNLRDELTRSLTQLGDLARLQGNPALAVQYCSQSCNIATEDGLWQASLTCHQCLYEAQKALGNSAQALQEYEAYIAVKDSIFSLENAREIAELEARLTYEKQLAEAEAEQVQLESIAREERVLRWIFAGSTLALALLSWFALRIGRLRRRQNEALQVKNEQIAEDRELISQQAQKLEQLAAAKNRFFTNISHELRTPLTLIVSPLEQVLARVNQVPEKVSASLKIVKSNADKLLALVEELLELSRLETGVIVAEEISLLFAPFIQQLFLKFEGLAQDKTIQYELFYRVDDDLQIMTDPQRLEKIIGNLLHNALKFTPKNGKVNLTIQTITTDSTILEIRVQDTGPGIAPDDLTAIFDRYFQGNNSTGIGIGLALARESALLIGGELQVESTLQEGSTFVLNLPLQSPIEPATPLLPLESSIPAPITLVTLDGKSMNRRILIVEDNQELQAFIAQVLAPYNCSLASNGREALALLRQARDGSDPFELVVTDLMMPEVDGNNLIQQIKADDTLNTIRIVVLTARHNLSEKLDLLRIGVDDYLHKPFSPEELSIRVVNLLRFQIPLEPDTQLEEGENSNRSTWLREVEELIEQLLQSQQKLSAGVIASKLSLSNRQLLRKIRAATGLSTQLYLQECKLQLARRYLEQKQFSSLSEVAKACGFSTPSYFSKVFQERFSTSPGAYFQ